ncbi:hypothetical protein ABLT60_09710, partial [Acinetobacter ursingii]
VRGIASSKFGLAIEFYLLAIFYTSNVNRPYFLTNKFLSYVSFISRYGRKVKRAYTMMKEV